MQQNRRGIRPAPLRKPWLALRQEFSTYTRMSDQPLLPPDQRARELLSIQIAALEKTRDQLPSQLGEVVGAMTAALDAGHKILVSGIGKSFHIGQKIAGTLTSTGSQAFVLHPSEALHGDIGAIQPGDILLILSYSGESDELLRLLPYAQRAGAKIACLTGRPGSSAAQLSDWVLPVEISREACPFNLAPTASMLAMLALGDALAVLIHEQRGFTREAYARLHPAGAIGRSLRLNITDVMRPADRLPVVGQDDFVKEAVLAMTRCRSGAVAVVDTDQIVVGIVTDGDLRRHIRADFNIAESPVRDIMTRNPKTLPVHASAVDVMKAFEESRIDDLIVIDDGGRLAGMVDIQDMPKLKLF